MVLLRKFGYRTNPVARGKYHRGPVTYRRKSAKFFSEALSLLRNDRVNSKDDDLDLSKWGDLLDVQKLLKRSRRIVYRILDENVIQSMPVRGTTLYYLPDFLKVKIKGACLENTKIDP